MMNKKARLNVMAFLTNALIFAIIIFTIFAIWGTGGGFKAIYSVGKIMGQIPAWVYLGIGVVWLIGQMR